MGEGGEGVHGGRAGRRVGGGRRRGEMTGGNGAQDLWGGRMDKLPCRASQRSGEGDTQSGGVAEGGE